MKAPLYLELNRSGKGVEDSPSGVNTPNPAPSIFECNLRFCANHEPTLVSALPTNLRQSF